MNTSAKPCTDFYQYACGNWEYAHRIPDDLNRIGAFNHLAEKNQEFLIATLESAEQAASRLGKDDASLLKKLSTIYQSCLKSWDSFDDAAPRPYTVVFDELAVIFQRGVLKQLPVASSYLQMLGAESLLNADVMAHPDDPEAQILVVSPGGLGLPLPEYYSDETILDVYRNTIESILEHTVDFGDGRSMSEIASMIVDFEAGLAKNMTLKMKNGLAQAFHSKDTSVLSSAVVEYPNLGIDEFIENLYRFSNATFDPKFTNNTYVAWSTYMNFLDKYLGEASPESIAYHSTWMGVRSTIAYLPEMYSQLSRKLNEVVYGTKALPLPSIKCLHTVDEMMGFATGRFFVLSKFNNESRKAVMEIVDGVKDEFRQKLGRVVWLENSVRDAAKEKIDKMRVKIGYPDMVADAAALAEYYRELEPTKSLFDSHRQSGRIELARTLSKMGRPTNHEEWYMYPHVVNAYYSPTKNEIVFPAGILQPPFYDAQLPGFINYGAIGAVIGHEFSHAFDTSGRNYDGSGARRNWWTDKTLEVYNSRAKCYVQQYSKFTVVAPNGDIAHVDGDLTVGENLADNSGIIRSWNTWKASRKTRQSITLPGKVGTHSDEQLFFISFAHLWCGKSRAEFAYELLKEDPHSPNFARVIGTLQNTKEFSAAFHCTKDDMMDPQDKCDLWRESE